MIFGAIIGTGIIAMLIAPLVSRMLRFFPPVVTGSIITVIGVTLMPIGINWIFGLPVGPTGPWVVDPEHAEWPTNKNHRFPIEIVAMAMRQRSAAREWFWAILAMWRPNSPPGR